MGAKMIGLRTILALSILILSGSFAHAQQNPLLGAWTIVSVNDERPGGAALYGADPQGLLIFDSNGRYSLQLCASGRPKFAANDRTKATAEESRAAVEGCNPHWGRYSIDETGKYIIFKIDHAMFANWEGTEQKRAFTIEAGILRYQVPNPPVGGANPVVIWKRASE